VGNTGIDRDHIEELSKRERSSFAKARPKSRDASKASSNVLMWGVPMVWQAGIEGPFSVFIEGGRGNRVIDIDGHEYLDFSMGVYATLSPGEPCLTMVDPGTLPDTIR